MVSFDGLIVRRKVQFLKGFFIFNLFISSLRLKMQFLSHNEKAMFSHNLNKIIIKHLSWEACERRNKEINFIKNELAEKRGKIARLVERLRVINLIS